MKLAEVYTTRLNETLDKALPYQKLSDAKYLITLDEQNKLLVMLHQKKVQQYNCLSVLFVNPNSSSPTATTNFFNGPSAVRVFSTIIVILNSIPFDIVFFTPDDSNIDIEGKKASLYGAILMKMARLGKILFFETIQLPEFGKPIFIGVKRGYELSNSQLEDITREYGRSKIFGR